MSQNALLRVTQMNALYFDNEIYKIFSELVQDIVKHLPPGFTARFNTELNLLLKLLILNYSVVRCNGTFGQKLLSVQYGNMNILRKLLYILANCLEYIKDKIEGRNTSRDLNKLVAYIYSVINICSFINVSVFLRSGVKPQLLERILGLNQVYTRDVRRQYDTQYMTRELLWDSFIEILVYIVPLVNYHKLKRTVRNLNPFHRKPDYYTAKSRSYTFSTKCPHCGEAPILPHHMGCTHIFCYSCLKGNQMADSKYQCPVCEYSNFNNICEKVYMVN